jgi:hypothetical protein
LTADSQKAVTESIREQATLLKAEESFRAALDARFGTSAEMLADPPDDLTTAVGRLAGGSIQDEKVRAVREQGSWKLSLGFAPDGKRTAQLAAAAEQIALRVQAGEFKDRLSAMVVLDHAWALPKSAGQ